MRIPSLDGLRAVSILLVLVGHLDGTRNAPDLDWLAAFGNLPHLGVRVFFVISGFLITGLLLAEARANGSVSLIDFYLRRARRILPAAASIRMYQLRSMAAGAPTVATRVGGTPEALVDGVSGLLVPPGDAGALVRAISRLLDDAALASRLGSQARARIADAFSVGRMVSATENLYSELLARKHRPRVAAAC